MRFDPLVSVDALPHFVDRLDTRTPAEFADDHLPSAQNCPVLSNDERATVGTIYAKQSAFEAKKLGAILVARNIARMIETIFSDRPRDWQPLVYCWRGGARSAALVHVLNQIGWMARQLQGGYREYRRWVVRQLEIRPLAFSYRVICGPTGSGKSHLLRALEKQGAQVLDLEMLAAHRGSLLGDFPDSPQPSQKSFETRLLSAMTGFNPQRPVFVEAESKRIGKLQLPDALVHTMWGCPCVHLETGLADRIALLQDEYRHFLEQPRELLSRLNLLLPVYGRQTLEHWRNLTRLGDWNGLVVELLERHYDPAYKHSTHRHFSRLEGAPIIRVASHDAEEFERIARLLACASASIEAGSP